MKQANKLTNDQLQAIRARSETANDIPALLAHIEYLQRDLRAQNAKESPCQEN